MGQTYSQEWKQFVIHFGIGTAGYISIFMHTFLKMQKRPLKHSDFKNVNSQSLNYSTNVISTINAIICSFVGFIGLFYYKLWKDSNLVIRRKIPLFLFYSWSYVLSYFLSDALCHIFIVAKYYKYIKSLKIDIIGHHIFGILMFILIQIPNPIYFWLWYNFFFFGEMSTIFLNAKWFSVYYESNMKTKQMINYFFVISWFLFRMSATYICFILLNIYWKQINEEVETTKVVMLTCIIILNCILQTHWSSKIIYNIYRNICAKIPNQIESQITKPKRNKIHGQPINLVRK